MAKASLNILWGYGGQSVTDGEIENLDGPCFNIAKGLFDLGPAGFDRVKVWGIGWQVA